MICTTCRREVKGIDTVYGMCLSCRSVMPDATLIKSTQHSINKWDRRFLDLAQHISQWSKDPSTKCGAVIAKGNRIISMGYNGFPMLVNDHSDNYNDRDLKLNMILHAEVNAILFAEVPLSNCTIYTYPFPPCCRCAAQIIQSGIRKVIAPKPTKELIGRWSSELIIAEDMYKDAGVILIEVE